MSFQKAFIEFYLELLIAALVFTGLLSLITLQALSLTMLSITFVGTLILAIPMALGLANLVYDRRQSAKH